MSPASRTHEVPIILNPSARNGTVLERVDPLRSALHAKGLQAEVVESTSETHAGRICAGNVSLGLDSVVQEYADSARRI
ncbi:hypothetical protein [Luteipulveratus mongoliensis]|uniref:DAGKc domain-containing protein n=1 Tax=Luteipulveratus mongoliensis TaxID=571913 RepID=A0A0K1JJW6_9MICO|nr:hypothetical protein [Luteipulveratus mongoliensis]AKU16865.1 hypothetical protein VV02_14965 [Luteipulveratus mongoliensis]